MCRFVFYHGPAITLGSLVTEPRNSLIHQSFHNEERPEPLNGDGFGVAWYAPRFGPEPALFRAVTPAWNNQNLRNLARVTSSGTILAHVRAASPGLPVIRLNCHPFVWRHLAFMHNGVLGGFRQMRRPLLARLDDEAFFAIGGSTDSEHFFALIIQRYLERAELAPAERLVAALRAAIDEVETLRRDLGIEEPSTLNVVLADGSHAAATRYISEQPETACSLYLHHGARYLCEGGACRMDQPGDDGSAVIIASERLSDDDGWHRVEPNRLIIVDGKQRVVTEPLVPHLGPPLLAAPV